MFLKLTPNLTAPSTDLDYQLQRTHVGQAHFAGTGPFGTSCGECAFFGYFKQHRNQRGDVVSTTKVFGCAKFKALTGKNGPAIPKHAESCRHFERDVR